jgi:hypothetical protein
MAIRITAVEIGLAVDEGDRRCPLDKALCGDGNACGSSPLAKPSLSPATSAVAALSLAEYLAASAAAETLRRRPAAARLLREVAHEENLAATLAISFAVLALTV